MRLRREATPHDKRRNNGNRGFGILHNFVGRDEAVRGPLPELTTRDILAWADAYFRRWGCWPTFRSGAIRTKCPEPAPPCAGAPDGRMPPAQAPGVEVVTPSCLDNARLHLEEDQR